MSGQSTKSPTSTAKWLFLALAFSLAVMKPDVRYPIMATDLLFLLAAAALAVEVVRCRRRLRWRPAYAILAFYWLSLSASLIVTPDAGATLLKSAATLYLVGLAVLADQLIDDMADVRRAILSWLAGTALVAAIGVASLALFPFAPRSPLIEAVRFHSGTLPPGDYLRLAVTFWNANMLCNYLTASLGLILAARRFGWMRRGPFALLLAGMLITASFSISPGLGGMALLGGLWIWLTRRETAPRGARLALAAGVAVACAFIVSLAFTPFAHPTAPFLITLPGGFDLAPSGRFLTWAAALEEWARNPLLGHGLGIGAVEVRYQDPTGYLQRLTDAHNVFLNIAAQSGIVGLAGLGVLIALAIRLTSSDCRNRDLRLVQLGLGLTFLNGFVYQGLGGSFEDARHLWVLLGLMLAVDRLARAKQDGWLAGPSRPRKANARDPRLATEEPAAPLPR